VLENMQELLPVTSIASGLMIDATIQSVNDITVAQKQVASAS